MGGTGRSNPIKTKYAASQFTERPFFIPESNWEIFYSHIHSGLTVNEIAERRGISVSRVRHVLADVDRQISLPRGIGPEWTQLTANSPVEDLQISVRARNRLRELGCARVEDLLRLDLGNSRMGRTTRVEVLAALEHSGFRHHSHVEHAKSDDLRRVSQKLKQLRNRMEQNLSAWKYEVERIEARLRRILEKE